jgi:hypothetical protein
MVAAFDDPAFLRALEGTGFWAHVENTTKRHPEWEALLERQLLLGINPAKTSSTPTSSQKQ